MLSDNEIKEIIKKNELNDTEILEVIRRYIYDIKNIDVGKIERPNGILCINYTFKHKESIYDFELMHKAYLSCLKYYGEKFN